MDEVLILGNGISRMDYHSDILKWTGEIWGCNRIYLEYGDRLTRLTGHADVLEYARQYREEKGYSYEIWAGHLGKSGAEKLFTCPGIYRKDSGSTLIAQAMEEGKKIALAGFDFGGLDVHSPGLEKDPKPQWVKRFRAIMGQYGWDRVRFIGYDHLPYLRTLRDPAEYAKKYIAGKPHILDKTYIDRWQLWTGKDANPIPKEEVNVLVQFNDGRQAEVKERIAEKMIKKGKAKVVGQKQVKQPELMEDPKKTAGVQRKRDSE